MTQRRRTARGAAGPTVQVVWWRDIPAQVIARDGDRTVKRELAERFALAIDRAAMRGRARDADAYLADWRRAPGTACDADLEAAAERLAARLEADYDAGRLDALVQAGGIDPDTTAPPAPDASAEKGPPE